MLNLAVPSRLRVPSFAPLDLLPRCSRIPSPFALPGQRSTPQSWRAPALRAKRVTMDDFPKRIVVPLSLRSPPPTSPQTTPCAYELCHFCARDPAV